MFKEIFQLRKQSVNNIHGTDGYSSECIMRFYQLLITAAASLQTEPNT
jgi:hypothetical protein